MRAARDTRITPKRRPSSGVAAGRSGGLARGHECVRILFVEPLQGVFGCRAIG